MSDVKFCPNCGTSLSASALFCHKCGQKQNIASEPVPSATLEGQDTEVQTSVAQELNDVDTAAPSNALAEEPVVPAEEAPIDEPQVIPPPAIQSEVEHQDTYVQSTPQTPDQPISQQPDQPIQTQPQQPNQQEPQQYPQYYYSQNNSQPPAPAVKKKKFPWFFTVLWLIALGAIGVWGYFIFAHDVYPGPEFTEDAKRIAIFLGAAFILIYTLSLKLTMKKLRVVPTIILVLALLVVVYLFGMIELIEGDWFHDALIDITDKVLPVFGK